MTMACFLRAYYVLFWKPHFDWIKIADLIENFSGHASRHMPAHAFVFCLNLMKLNKNWSAESEFQ